MKDKTVFEQVIEMNQNCDICGSIMLPMYGGGWDNDRIVCTNRECCAEIEFPTSTEYIEKGGSME